MKTQIALICLTLGCLVACSKRNSDNVSSSNSTLAPKEEQKLDYALVVDKKPGFVRSPYAPNAGYIDVRGFPKDTEVKDPYSGEIFLIPETNSTTTAAVSPSSRKAAQEFRIAKIDLKEALDFIGAQAGIKVYYTPAKTDSSKITLKLSDVPADEAFRFAAQAANLDITYKEDGIYFTQK